MVSLAEAATVVGAELHGAQGRAEASIASVTHDSRMVDTGTVFACVVGENADGHDFAEQAEAAGAIGLVVQRVLDVDLPQLLVADVRASLGPLAAAVWGHPSKSLKTIGVTGTAGKTTVVHLLEAALEILGAKSGSIGTLNGPRTTPEATDLQSRLDQMVQDGVEAVAMEVSSHALDLGRVAGTHFDVAVFTNLGHDHLDFHKTMERYAASKAKLFTTRYTDCAVINADDPVGADLIAVLSERGEESSNEPTVRPYSLQDAEQLESRGSFNKFLWKGHSIQLQLAGDHNVLNALAVATSLEALGYEQADISAALSQVRAPAGRFEILSTDRPFDVVIDYAHKPEALVATLATARGVVEQSSGRVLLVFGCGGDRDQDKRALMAVASAAADVIVVTSDNPRSEDPNSIIADIVTAMPAGSNYQVKVDRLDAIQAALKAALAGDVVVIAGKGHETYQEVNGQRLEFSDRVVTQQLLSAPQ